MSDTERRLNEPSLIGQKQQSQNRAARSGLRESTDRAWRAVGWFGLLLAVVGLADVAMVWFPPAFGNATWAFGAVDMSVTSLPLLTMGLAALLSSAFARGATGWLWTLGGFLIVLGLALLVMYVVFYALSIPLALKATPAAMKVGIWKSIAKTTLLSVLFPIAYVVAGVAALRNTGRG